MKPFGISIFLVLVAFLAPASSDAAILARPVNNLGLVGWWTFDSMDLKPNVRDRSGNGGHGFLTTGATTTTLGKIGQAFTFDGTYTKYINAGTVADSVLTNQVTVSMWVYRVTGSQEYSELLGDENYGGNQGFYLGDMTTNIGDGNDSTYGFRINGGTGNSYLVQESSITYNQWVHYVGVYDGDYVYLYKDGVLVDSDNHPDSSINVDSGSASIGFGFNGSLDDVRIYSRAISASEVKNLYNGAASKFSTSNTPAGLKNGLVGHWTFDSDDLKPNVRDVSSQGNHANLIGQTPTTTVPGILGQALSFDGVDDFILRDDIDITGNVSVAAWIYMNAGGLDQKIVGNQDSIAGGYKLGVYTNNKVEFEIRDGANAGDTNRDTSGGTTLSTGQWYHVVGVYDDANNIIATYVNGVLDRQETAIRSLAGSEDFVIGREPYNVVGYWNGRMDDVRVYNKTLTAAEIKQLYAIGSSKVNSSANNKAGSLSSGLVGWWTFDSSDLRPNVRDRSGNGNHGNLSGQTSTTTAIGKLGQALNFDGSNDKVEVGSPASLDDLGPLSVSVWLKLNTIGQGSLAKIVAKNGVGGVDGMWQVFLTSGIICNSANNVIAFQKAGGGGGIASAEKCSAADTVTFGDWQHFVVTWDGSQGLDNAGAHIYKNGTEVSYITTGLSGVAPASDASLDFVIGNRPAGDRTIDGAMDELRVYNRVLSASEAKQLYNLGR